MTREEREYAIEFFEQMAAIVGDNAKYSKLAIEALEQEPCEDCISRQAMLKIQAKYAEYMGATKFWQMCDDIKELPPVTPQQKTGHWIIKRTFPTKIYDEYLSEYKCSECYREIRCTESQLVNYPYCHCGAKMIEPQERSDKE